MSQREFSLPGVVANIQFPRRAPMELVNQLTQLAARQLSTRPATEGFSQG